MAGGAKHFEGDNAAVGIVVHDDAVAEFIALSDRGVAEDEAERVGFAIVDDLHGLVSACQYFAILDVR